MKNNYSTYDPSDIESLLRHKAFDELSDSEKDLAMELCGSEADYTSMRHTLLNITDSFAVEEIVPDDTIKAALLERFQKTHATSKSGAGFWSRLFPAERSFFASPGFQLAGVAVVMLVLGLVFLNRDSVNTHETALIDGEQVEENTIHKTPSIEAEKAEDKLIVPEEKANEEIATTDEKVVPENTLTDKFNLMESPVVAGNTSTNDVIAKSETENFKDFNASTLSISDSTLSYNKKANSKAVETVSRKKENPKVENDNDMRSEPQADLYKEYESSHVTTTSGMATKNDIPSKKNAKSVSANDKPEMLDLLFTSL